jgi:phosphoglycolate phosphatase
MPTTITTDELFRAASVVFDLDGTLADTVYDVAVAYCMALPKFGFTPPNPETLRIGPPAEYMVREMIGQNADPMLVADIVNEFRLHYDTSDYPKTKLYPGTAELLKRLKDKGIRLSIATYKRAVSTRRLLEIKGIADLFDEILSIEHNGEHWTKHQMLTYIMEATQTKPSETLFFGDSVGDIEAGRDLDIKTVAVLYGYEPPDDLLAMHPDFVCKKLIDLLTPHASRLTPT